MKSIITIFYNGETKGETITLDPHYADILCKLLVKDGHGYKRSGSFIIGDK